MPIWRSSTAFCSASSSLALCILLAAPAWAQQIAAMQAGDARLEVEIVATPEARERGLMHRDHLPEQRGMWFVFDATEIHCLWMKNTPLPLSAAFVAEDGRVINIVEMDPLTLDPHCASAPARFALEVNRGWFEHHGVRAGSWLLPPPH